MLRKCTLSQLPRTIELTMDHDVLPTWTPLALVEGATKAVAMEASSHNLQQLFLRVDHELTHGCQANSRADVALGSSMRRAPRGEKGAREYFVRGRWVTKLKVPGARQPDGRSRAPVFRTLAHRRTNPVEDHPAAARARHHSSAHVGMEEAEALSTELDSLTA